MTSVTISMYLVAGGFCACLCILMLALGRMVPDAQLMRGGAAAVGLMTIAFTVSGFAAEVPAYATRVGSNLTLLAAGVVIHSALTGHFDRGRFAVDWLGWAVVLLAAPAFWYWGLEAPNGAARSVVFSFAAATISGRTAVRAVASLRGGNRGLASWLLAAALTAWSLWMAVRGVYLLVADPAPSRSIGVNPTSWPTVLGFMAILSILTAGFVGLEFGAREAGRGAAHPARPLRVLAYLIRSQWTTLGAVVIALVVITVGTMAVYVIAGYSEADTEPGMATRTRWVILSAFSALAVVLLMAAWVGRELKRRTEQERFLAMLSHELKTPLSVLHMALDQAGEASARTRQHAEQSLRDIDAIVQRLIQADRLQYRPEQLQVVACDPLELLHAVVAGSHEPARIRLGADADIVLRTDATLLTIALQNLVDNAVKYGLPGGAIELECRRRTHLGRTGVLIDVRHGVGPCGTPDPERVFEKYYRSPHARSKTGSGLGLYLVQSIARLLGGWVRYEPDPAGTQVHFAFWLPGQGTAACGQRAECCA
jgi:signal transduction histidine kinase